MDVKRGETSPASASPRRAPSAGLQQLNIALLTKPASERTPEKRAADWRNAVRAEFAAAPDSALFGDDVAALILDTNTSTLSLWRMASKGPTWVRVGKSPKYQKAALLQFILENTNGAAGA
jgi:hypothetical protein